MKRSNQIWHQRGSGDGWGYEAAKAEDGTQQLTDRVANSEVLVNFCFARGGIFHFWASLNRLWQVGNTSSQRPKFAKIVFWVTCQKLKFAVSFAHNRIFFIASQQRMCLQSCATPSSVKRHEETRVQAAAAAEAAAAGGKAINHLAPRLRVVVEASPSRAMSGRCASYRSLMFDISLLSQAVGSSRDG